MWNKITTELTAIWTAYGDKLLHIGAGLALGFAFGMLRPAAGVGVAILAGLGKELYDMRDGGTGFDVNDLFATVAGGILGAAVAWMIR